MDQNPQLDERMERYLSQRLSTRLKIHIDTQALQAGRKAKLRLLLIVVVVAALVALAATLSVVWYFG